MTREGIAKTLIKPFRQYPWWKLGLKIALIISFCGGPMALIESLETLIYPRLAMVVGVAPLVALLFGGYSVKSATPDLLDRWFVFIGFMGAAVLIAMNLFGVYQLVASDRTDAVLLTAGIAIGAATSFCYAYMSIMFFRQSKDSGLAE